MRRPALLLQLLILPALLAFSASASAALVEYSGANNVVGSDGVSRHVQVWNNRTPTAFTYVTEELEVLENHGMMKFLDGTGSP